MVADHTYERYLVKDLEHCEDGARKITVALEVPIYKDPCPKAFWGDDSKDNTVLGWGRQSNGFGVLMLTETGASVCYYYLKNQSK